jgi:hypothetical protein
MSNLLKIAMQTGKCCETLIQTVEKYKLLCAVDLSNLKREDRRFPKLEVSLAFNVLERSPSLTIFHKLSLNVLNLFGAILFADDLKRLGNARERSLDIQTNGQECWTVENVHTVHDQRSETYVESRSRFQN